MRAFSSEEGCFSGKLKFGAEVSDDIVLVDWVSGLWV